VSSLKRVSVQSKLRQLHLKDLDALANSFHGWAIGYAVAEGAASGSLGLPGIAVDIPLLVTMALGTVQAIGLCYGYLVDSETEREFVLGILAAAGANSLQEKTAALLLLRQLEITILKNTFKKMAAKAAEQSLGKEAAIVALRNLARQLGVNLTTANWTFMDDVAWAARRSYQERWFADREGPQP
jgi:hypothetical protein